MKRITVLLCAATLFLWGTAFGSSYGGELEYDLTLAAVEGDQAKVNALLAKGADPNTKDGTGTTVTMEACREARVEIVKVLLAKGAKLNERNNRGMTALMIVSERGNDELVKLLLEKGADPNMKTPSGATALSLAVAAGHAKTADLLKSKGAK